MRTLALTLLVFFASPAVAADTLVAGSYAVDCARQAAISANGGQPSSDAISLCDHAITDESLSSKNVSATYVDRGVLYLPAAPVLAENDFRTALQTVRNSGDIYVDIGAAEIAEGHDAAGIRSIDKGLTLPMKEPAKAYFDRALAEDAEGATLAAYRDFRQALALRPGWRDAVAELARFTVHTVSN